MSKPIILVSNVVKIFVFFFFVLGNLFLIESWPGAQQMILIGILGILISILLNALNGTFFNELRMLLKLNFFLFFIFIFISILSENLYTLILGMIFCLLTILSLLVTYLVDNLEKSKYLLLLFCIVLLIFTIEIISTVVRALINVSILLFLYNLSICFAAVISTIYIGLKNKESIPIEDDIKNYLNE